MKNRPLFIVFEGVDGSGKTTQINLLKEKFQATKQAVVDTFEPTDSPIGGMIRNIMRRRMDADPATIAGLFVADRLDHINNKVNGMKQYLERGFTVICSRYYFSSYAFQQEYVPLDWLVSANSLPKQQLKPDLIVYLNVHPEKSMHRINEGRVEKEIYETLEKTKSAHQGYMDAFQKYGADENIHILDGSAPIKEIGDKIWALVQLLR